MPGDDSAFRILDLPPEITAQIFVHCLPLDLDPPSLLTAPLLLGQICTLWRTIAWQTPDLWTALKVDSARIPITLVEAWLGRAGTLPLSLAIAILIWQEEEWDCKAVITVFKRYSSTWRKIALEIPWEAFEFLAAEPPLDLPLLDSLAIWTEGLDDLDGAPPLRAFRDAHALRKLSVVANVNPNALELPWTQLTSFECHTSGGINSHDFLTILQHTPNLVECDAAVYHYGHSIPSLPDVPALTSLTSLVLGMSDVETMGTFSHITLPALQILDLSRVLFSGRELVELLRPFLSNPDCRLRELMIRLDEDPPEEEDFMQLLEAQPSLEKIDLCEGHLGLIIALCRRLCDGSAFLPRLSCLCASPTIYPVSEITEVFPVMLDALDDALHARNMLSSDCFVKIQKCVIKDWSGVRADDLDTIVERFRPRQRELIALGIDLVVGDE
ncbi:hypothetical protein R3P38DRAFT_2560792 [Favolaschia claudopus]|uniref:F-box domain-containing protein n=1 Tax=Favolaschia claudopus TaxID=2862362 RepID=A0AAW0A3C9_9AGAR